MALPVLLICTLIAWMLSVSLDRVPHLLGLLVPSHWLVLGGLLVLVTWLMRD